MSQNTILSSASSILSGLNSDEQKIQVNALKRLDKILDTYWHEIADHITTIESLYEDKTFPERKLAASIVSKVYYHLEDYDEAVNYALESGENFDAFGSTRTQYIDVLIGKCIDRYIKQRLAQVDENKDADNSETYKKLEDIIAKIFAKSITDKDFKTSLGIAVDARRIDKVAEILSASNNNSDVLGYLTKLAQNTVVNRKFRFEVFRAIVRAYQSGTKNFNDYLNICNCLFLLDDSKSVAAILFELIRTEDEDKELLAYQIATDLNENDNQGYIDRVLKDMAKEEISVTATPKKENLVKILKGKFKEENQLNFFKVNNQTDPLILNNVKAAIDQKNSIAHSGVLFANSIMNAYTTNDSFLRTNLDWVAKATHWAKFSATASLGTIHRTNYGKAMEILNPYFPGSSPNPHFYTHGGSLYGLGLIHAGEKNQDVINFLINAIKNPANQANEIIIHGACLGLGLVCFGMGDQEEYVTIYEELKNILETDSATTGEAAGLAIGLLMVGSANQQVLQDLLTQAHESSHEKILRSLAISLALIMYGKEEGADLLIEQLTLDKDPILRYGAMYMIGMAYVGTSNNDALKKLLHFAVSDVSDDVRRAAVTNIGFLMLKNSQQIPKIVNLLSGSFNPHVRYGATLAMGLACAGTAYPDAIALLEPMLNDSVDFVRQGAMLSMSMVLQQVTVQQEPKVEKFRNQLNEIITKKHEDPLARLGALLSTGIIDAGGRNGIIQLLTPNGYPKIKACAGMVVFLDFYYWFPLIHFLSLTLAPAGLIAANKDLKVPKSFEFKTNAKPSLYDYPPHLKPTDKKKEVKTTTVTLSVTDKVKARQLKKIGEKEGMEIEAPKKEEVKEEDKKMEIEGEKVEKKKEEPNFKVNTNFSRVLPKQADFVAYLDDNRYQPILKSRKRGIVFLKDTRAGETEEYQTGEIPEKVEPHLVPPETFEFDESSQKSAGKQ
jgi:26S proteasome regulatory subunit N2